MVLQVDLTFCELDDALRLMEARLVEPLFFIPPRPLPSILPGTAMFFLRLKQCPHRLSLLPSMRPLPSST